MMPSKFGPQILTCSPHHHSASASACLRDYHLYRPRRRFQIRDVPVSTETDRPERRITEQPETGPQARPGLAAAIGRAQGYLLSIQQPDGFWVGELMVDSTLVSDTVAYHHWNGKVDPAWQRKAVHHILSMQLPDGGWNIYHGGPAEVNATIKAYLALKLAGVPVTDPRMLRARQVALRMGGVPRTNTFSKLYLALLGLFPWDY